MCRRTYNPNFLFMWPNARISVMGGPQAVGVLAQIERSSKKKQEIEWTEEEEETLKNKVVGGYERKARAYYSTARLWDDGIIDPADTRKVLGLCLSASMKNVLEETKYGVFRMQRFVFLFMNKAGNFCGCNNVYLLNAETNLLVHILYR
ncbi:methylcrotonoyl-CoA carboxylase [Ranunculus cassubicifolius]